MQPVRQILPPKGDVESDQHPFWSDIMRIAVKGVDHPTSLTENEIQKVCQLALVALPKRVVLAKCGVAERLRVTG